MKKNSSKIRSRLLNGALLVLLLSVTFVFQNCAGKFETVEIASNKISQSDSSATQQPQDPQNPQPSPNPNPQPQPQPSPAPTPSPAPAPAPQPQPTPVPAPSPSPVASGFMIGQHFHRPVGTVLHKYMFARTHDNESVSEGRMKWWVGNDSYDFKALDTFRDYHKSNGAKLLITFYGTPQFASARPNEPNRPYPSMTGSLAEPKDLNSYGRMVQATVSRYKNDLYAVECWNEPFADSYNGYDLAHAEFFSGSPTALADMCKALYTNTKAASPNTPVICPAEAYRSPIVVNSKTSQGESILKYCDMIGWHPYGWTGVPGVGGNLSEYVDQINKWTAAAGYANKPIAITEWGVAYYGNVQSQYQNMSSTEKANVLYQTLKMAYQKGVKAFGMYGYDDELVGINGTDGITASGITKAVDEFGGK